MQGTSKSEFDWLLGRKLNPAQERLIYGKEKHMIWSGNRGQGKTRALCWFLGRMCLMVPGNSVILGRAVKDDLYATTLDAWYWCFPSKAFRLEYEGGKEGGKPTSCLFPNGSRCHFIGFANDEKWLGMEIGAFGVDQVEQIEKESWLTLEGNLRRDNVPVELFQGRGVGNPAGHYWGLLRCREKHELPPHMHKDYLWLKAPKYENRHNIKDPHYYERMEGSYHGAYRKRMLDGDDDAFEGAAFPEFDDRENKMEISRVKLSDWSPVVSMDYGYLPAPTVFLLGYYNPRTEEVHVVAEHVATATTVPDHVKIVRRMAEVEGFPLASAKMIADFQIKGIRDAKGKTIWDEYRDQGFVFDSSVKSMSGDNGSLSKANRLLSARMRVYGDRSINKTKPLCTVDPKCRTLLSQLTAVTVDMKHGKEDLVGQHDAVDAFLYMLMGVPRALPQEGEKDITGTAEDWRVAAERGGEYAPTIGKVDWSRYRRTEEPEAPSKKGPDRPSYPTSL